MENNEKLLEYTVPELIYMDLPLVWGSGSNRDDIDDPDDETVLNPED